MPARPTRFRPSAKGHAMNHVLAELAPRDRYKLLSSLVIPRPIALVTSLSAEGGVNAAPYSFFNVFSHEPALVVLGIERRAPGVPKDTGHNLVERTSSS